MQAVEVPLSLNPINTGFLTFVNETEVRVTSLKSSILSQYVF
jgi:hypothetical protein